MLNKIKSQLKDCSYISFVKTKVRTENGFVDRDAVKAVILRPDGKRDKVELVLPVRINNLTEENYEQILSYLKNKEYNHVS